MLPKTLERLDVFGNDFECACDDITHQNYINDHWEEYSQGMKPSLNYECSNYEETILVRDVDLSYCGRFVVPDEDATTEIVDFSTQEYDTGSSSENLVFSEISVAVMFVLGARF
jgi:hypothetical protein